VVRRRQINRLGAAGLLPPVEAASWVPSAVAETVAADPVEPNLVLVVNGWSAAVVLVVVLVAVLTTGMIGLALYLRRLHPTLSASVDTPPLGPGSWNGSP
jgi:hypothetical protein